MKYLVLFFIFTPLFSFAQNKGDNQITVTTSLIGDELYKKIGQDLLDKGYTIEKSDKELGYIITNFKPVFGDRSLKIIVKLRDNKVMLSGLMGVGDKPTEANGIVIIYNPSGMLIFRKVWPYLEEIAKEIGGEISYTKT
ncbi:hypothetical protein [Xanthocytophaga agilis]|uniref:Uncharacterized protein n=1 Tax=Xanthocytophaga agilis TaxID=3048010 RepID=A0AAE3RC73_9BACT|nr:hypothetical protein [Xanthocytophaga agilis]MDJ1505519.1 hypothetical protein [Xanthocytophaga agilis]